MWTRRDLNNFLINTSTPSDFKGHWQRLIPTSLIDLEHELTHNIGSFAYHHRKLLPPGAVYVAVATSSFRYRFIYDNTFFHYHYCPEPPWHWHPLSYKGIVPIRLPVPLHMPGSSSCCQKSSADIECWFLNVTCLYFCLWYCTFFLILCNIANIHHHHHRRRQEPCSIDQLWQWTAQGRTSRRLIELYWSFRQLLGGWVYYLSRSSIYSRKK